MIDFLFRAGIELTLMTLGAIALVVVLQLLAFLVDVLPVPVRVRNSLQRLGPILGLAVLLAYVASAVAFLLEREPEFAAVLVTLVGLLMVFAWALLYDLISGVAFRFGRLCRVGDQVRVGDVQGRVLEIGMRALIVQTPEGDEAVVPYGKIGRSTLRRTQSVSGAHVHAFTIEQPDGIDFVSLKRAVVRAAMRCHWASVVHEPKVERRDGNAVEVSVYALDADHAPMVEAAVRVALSGRVVRVKVRDDLPSSPPKLWSP